MNPKKLLIFPAGTEIAFEIVNALKYSKFVELYGGTSVKDHSEFVYKNLIEGFPYINEEGFLNYLNDKIHQYHIDCVYPAHDSVSVFLSEHREEIEAQVIITEKFTTNICRSKAATYQYLAEETFIPEIYNSVEEVKNYPVFVKPIIGQGARGAKRVDNKEELIMMLKEKESLIICEYLPGMEYTIDCFTDKDGNLLVSKLRNRERIKAGISVRSKQLETDDEIVEIARKINRKFTFKGAWFFQVKKNSRKEYRLMEISPRIPGTMGVSRNLGINFPMLTLFVFWGYRVSILENQYNIMLDRAFYSAYKIDLQYDHIYLDFDDTLIIHNKVNQDLMRYVYQASNEGKKLHLLSKHKTDIYVDLKKYKIDPALFEDIIILSAMEEKSEYITEQNAIFIDDSFSERKKVKDNKGIAVFDLDMVESLIEWKF